MNGLTCDEVIQNTPESELSRILERLLLSLVQRARDEGRIEEVPVFGPETGNVIGWFRTIEHEVAAMEDLPQFRRQLLRAVQSNGGAKPLSAT